MVQLDDAEQLTTAALLADAVAPVTAALKVMVFLKTGAADTEE
jgi:hypothetical protein